MKLQKICIDSTQAKKKRKFRDIGGMTLAWMQTSNQRGCTALKCKDCSRARWHANKEKKKGGMYKFNLAGDDSHIEIIDGNRSSMRILLGFREAAEAAKEH